MGMSTHVIGFKPPDEKWQQMKDVWDSCEMAEVAPPEEVSEFFDWDNPDERGVEVDLKAEEWADDSCRSGYEICLDDIPEGVKYIRFYNSW